ncbi:MAG: hypothetical protein HY898_36385 [Deltaproteobacteria bacterium]|nr:hypothetical protein [Deltaproteobacteria bacterium]
MARTSLADEPIEPIRVAVSAPQPCSDAVRFTSQIQARTNRSRIAGENERARLFSAFLTLEAPGSRGTLVITDTDGKSLVREIAGSSCEEVASALALIAALAIDPNAPMGPLIVPPSTAAAPLPVLPTASVAPAPVAPAPEATVRSSPAPVPFAAPLSRAPLALDIGVGVEARGGVAPSLALAPVVFVDLYRERSSRFVRLGLVRTTDVHATQVDGTVKFAMSAARVELCPWAGALGGSVSAHACGRFEVGTLTADAQGPATAYSTSRAWVATGASGGVRWVPTRGFGVDGWLGASLPLVRDRFTWHDGTTVHHVPAAGFVGGISAAVQFL